MNITKENAKAAWDAGCSDVKRVLEKLFPEMEFETPKKYIKGEKYSITLEIEVIGNDRSDTPYHVSSVGAEDDDGEEFLDTWISEEQFDKLVAK